MRIDSIELINDTNIVNTKAPFVTEIERLALTPVGGEYVYQTDNAIGIYVYDGGIWILLGPTSGLAINNNAKFHLIATTYTFEITNHNVLSTYSGSSANGGNIVFNGDNTFEYTTPATAGIDMVTIVEDGINATFNIDILQTIGNNQIGIYSQLDLSVMTTTDTDIYILGKNFNTIVNGPSDEDRFTSVVVIRIDIITGAVVWSREYEILQGLSTAIDTFSFIQTDGINLFLGFTTSEAHWTGSGGSFNASYVLKMLCSNGDQLSSARFDNGVTINVLDGGQTGYLDIINNYLFCIAGSSLYKIDASNLSIIWEKEWDTSGLEDFHTMITIDSIDSTTLLIGSIAKAVGVAEQGMGSIVIDFNGNISSQFKYNDDALTPFITNPIIKSMTTSGTVMYLAKTEGTNNDREFSGILAIDFITGNVIWQKFFNHPTNEKQNFSDIQHVNGLLYITGTHGELNITSGLPTDSVYVMLPATGDVLEVVNVESSIAYTVFGGRLSGAATTSNLSKTVGPNLRSGIGGIWWNNDDLISTTGVVPGLPGLEFTNTPYLTINDTSSSVTTTTMSGVLSDVIVPVYATPGTLFTELAAPNVTLDTLEAY